MRGAAHEVGEDAEDKGGDEGGSPTCDQHREEGGVHGANVRGPGGEHVVAVEIKENHHQESGLPRESGGGDELDDSLGEPRDESVLVEVSRHGNEGGEPGEGVPGRALGEALLPGDDAGDEQGGEADECGGDGADANLGAEDPEADGDDEGGGHDLLVVAHGTELFELLLGFDGSFGGVLHLGGVEHVQDGGHADEADQPGEGSGERPLAPGDGLADGGGGQVHGQRIGSHGGDEHAGGDGGGLEDGQHDVGTHFLLCALLGVGAARHAERLGQGEEDTTRARREGGDGGSEQRLGEDKRVAQTQGGLAEDGDDSVRDAVSEASLDEATSEEEGKSDEPRNLRGERAESPGKGEDAEAHGHSETNQSSGAQGERLRMEEIWGNDVRIS